MTGVAQPTIFTIGHSRHPIDRFVALLQAQRVEVLVDVRSQPTSRWAPQFRRSDLARALEQAGIDYAFLGAELGGRPEGDWYDADGKLDAARRSRAPEFEAGIAELVAIARERTAAILCAEEDPTHCHRRVLVTPALAREGFAVVHLRGDGRVQPEDPAQRSMFP